MNEGEYTPAAVAALGDWFISPAVTDVARSEVMPAELPHSPGFTTPPGREGDSIIFVGT